MSKARKACIPTDTLYGLDNNNFISYLNLVPQKLSSLTNDHRWNVYHFQGRHVVDMNDATW